MLPSEQIVHRIDPPRRLITEMVAAGAHNDELKGENSRLMRLEEGVRSKAWEPYKQWCCSLGTVHVFVFAMVGREMDAESVFPIQQEANSIIAHMEHTKGEEIPAQLPDPLRWTQLFSPIRDGTTAVTGLLKVLTNPPANYPTIRSLAKGDYICDILYNWSGTMVTMPI